MGDFVRYAQLCGKVLLDALLPVNCLSCDAPVQVQGQFCAACFSHIHQISAPCCQLCGMALEHAPLGGMTPVCPHCAEHPPIWRQARAALRYDEHSRRVILPLKHHDRPELARALAVMMARAGAELLAQADVLVPVPLHGQRLRRRRYNQAALLAQAIGKLSHVKLSLDALIRKRATQSLGELSAEQRAYVVAGVFAVRPGRGAVLAGRNIVLIDDVLTSGATAAGCAEALLAIGAARVDVLVAARVPDPRLR